jgi:integrase
MVREGNKLTALKVAKLTKPGRYGDGHGLWLQITKSGGKSWIMRYMLDGRPVYMGLGPLHAVSLAEARIRARQYRQLLVEKRDPLQAKQEAIAAAKVDAARMKTFKQVTLEFLNESGNVQSFRNEKHRRQWESTLENYAFPTLGNMPLGVIDTAAIYSSIKPVWTRAPETASRLRGRIERILDFAKARGYLLGDNPARWELLKGVLPKKPKAEHHKAMPISELPAFMAGLREKESLSAKALEFLILTASRTNEVIAMRWSEVDFAKKLWVIPAKRMKAGKEHRVPLSDRAIAVLSSVPRNGSDMIFPLSNMAMLELLKGVAGNGYTTHGFRSSFRDWAGDHTNYSREVVEQALAHTIQNKVEAAYRRGDALQKRRHLMDDWARFCGA